jgi:hypothetical protein
LGQFKVRQAEDLVRMQNISGVCTQCDRAMAEAACGTTTAGCTLSWY